MSLCLYGGLYPVSLSEWTSGHWKPAAWHRSVSTRESRICTLRPVEWIVAQHPKWRKLFVIVYLKEWKLLHYGMLLALFDIPPRIQACRLEGASLSR